MKKYKAWSGRFKKETSSLMEKFNSSIAFDQRLYKEDITGSIAYAKALKKAGIISVKERDLIIKGLNGIKKEFDEGKFVISPYDEDIHMAVERRLVEKIGAAGKKLHTGRSRNDQVITDTRLFLKNAAQNLISELEMLQKSIKKAAPYSVGRDGELCLIIDDRVIIERDGHYLIYGSEYLTALVTNLPIENSQE